MSNTQSEIEKLNMINQLIRERDTLAHLNRDLVSAAEKAAKAMGRLRMGMGKLNRKTISMEAVNECTEEALTELQAAITKARTAISSAGEGGGK